MQGSDSQAISFSLSEGPLLVWPDAFTAKAKIDVSLDHPALNAKAYEMEDLKQNKRLAEVNLMPTLDVEAKIARDLGAGPNSLHETDALIGLQFSVPFNRTQAKAKRSKVEYEINTLFAKTEALKQSINAKLHETAVNLSYAKQLFSMQKEQVQLSQKLFEKEQRQFQLGSSDFFMLNSREVDAFNADLKALKTGIKVYREELEILKLEAHLDHAFVQQLIAEHSAH